ncbi:DUF58 domain-containing protein [Halostella sp. JP-L12]|uniref:DUF58 domain-containing protein n=1 Tax=Halostella TaxID=1843185 RepID=UPI000EF7F9C3|nr:MULTISPECIES: DUF58 domain-containing protein [Halostella]NHN47771.1 DUF58 domain-containing protein [Halostella sp. JP-L12]
MTASASASGESADVELADGASATPESETETDRTVETTARETKRWRGISAVALVAGGAGIVLRHPSLFLIGVIGVAYAAYARSATELPVSLAVERRLSDADPDPGDEVEVAVTVTNEGESTLPDLRLVDGVPDPLAVVDGVPRHGTSLRSGESATFEYTVVAGRGTHEFDHLLVVARGMSGAVETRARIPTADRLTCEPTFEPVSGVALRALTTRHAGRVETDDGGEGVEFHSTREYRPGDAISRIDWNRHARTGELATLRFRQERSATVVLLLDVREAAYLRPGEDRPHAVDRSVEAATAVFPSLLDAGNRVGIAAFGPTEAWLAPGLGTDHRARARSLFSSHAAFSPEPPETDFYFNVRLRRLRKRLPEDAQVILFSPLCDDQVVRFARLVDAHGHLVTVVSPDPTGDDTAGRRLAGAERAARITALRGAGVRVVDVPDGESIESALASAGKRWSR